MLNFYEKLVPRVKELWLEALRSGEYKQIIAKMRVTDRCSDTTLKKHGGTGHCCLGVLTELAKQDGAIPHFKVYSRGEQPLRVVRDWAGLSRDAMKDLMSFNDGHAKKGVDSWSPEAWHAKNRDNKSFDEIADWIDENL